MPSRKPNRLETADASSSSTSTPSAVPSGAAGTPKDSLSQTATPAKPARQFPNKISLSSPDPLSPFHIPISKASFKNTLHPAIKTQLQPQLLPQPTQQVPPLPSLATPPSPQQLIDLPSVILALNLESEFDSFFNTLVDICQSLFSATRVSLALPNDPADIYNSPWGLKGLWNCDPEPHSMVSPSSTLSSTAKRSESVHLSNIGSSEFNWPSANELDDNSWDTEDILTDSEDEDDDEPLFNPSPELDKSRPGASHHAPGSSSNTPDPTQRVNSPFDYVPLYSSSLNTLYQEEVDLITEKFGLASSELPGFKSAAVDAATAAKPISLRQKLSRRLSKSKRSSKPDGGASTGSATPPVSNKVTDAHTGENSITGPSETLLPTPNNNKHHQTGRTDTSRARLCSLQHPQLAPPLIATFAQASSPRSHNRLSISSSRPPLRPNLIMFDELQSLAWEKDALIDSSSITKIIKCGLVVLLQRKYTSKASSPTTSFFAPQYEEKLYFDSEQMVNSPWSCSPAPSPAIYDSPENPFFAQYGAAAPVSSQETSETRSSTAPKSSTLSSNSEMEAAFEYSDSDSSCAPTESIKKKTKPLFVPAVPASAKESVPAIGCENTVSIIHIPLIVPTRVSINQEAGRIGYNNTSPPIAVLSIMSPLIPYPGDLTEYLKQLTPHIATALVNAKVHTNLSNQLDSITSSSTATLFRPHRLSTSSVGQIYSGGASTIQSPTSSSHSSLSPEKSGARHRERLKRVGSFAFRHSYSKRMGLASVKPKASATSAKSTEDADDHSFSTPHRPSQLSHPGLSRSALPLRHLRKILESIPVQIYTMEPVTGNICWVSNRVTSYRGQSYEEFCADPYMAIHPKDKSDFLASLHDALRSGEAFSRMVYLRRFDGAYRASIYRCYPLRDDRGVTAFWLCTLFDVHQQRKAEMAAIKRAKETAGDHKYQILAESTPIIVFTFHPLRGVIYANKAWFLFSDSTKEETFGFEYVKRIHPADRDRCMVRTDSFKKHPLNMDSGEHEGHKKYPIKGSYTVEARLLDKNGQYSWHLITYTSLDANNLENGLWFGTCTNINDQKLNQAKLLEDKEEAQRTIESKTIFLSNMSHEIRTPLIGISGMVRFLFDTPLTTEQLDYCHTISSSADALLNVINDILDLSKVESGKMALTSSWYHVRRLIEEANEFLSSMAISKSLELNYIIESDVPMWVKGDKIRLRQVMLNIIGNAIKFTDKGEVFTRCSVVKESADGEAAPDTVLLKFEVVDTGRGFSSEDEMRMFKPFSQLRSNHREYEEHNDSKQTVSLSSSSSETSSTASSIPSVSSSESSASNQKDRQDSVASIPPPTPTFTSPGTGLGLVISRQLIQLQGGSMTCKSRPGKGSKFVFTCRVNLPTETDKPPVEETLPAAPPPLEASCALDILIICPCEYAPLSIAHHIKNTVADPSKCECTTAFSDNILREYLNGERGEFRKWTHVIINNSKTELVETTKVALEYNAKFGWAMEIVLLVPLIQESTIISGINGGVAGEQQRLPANVRVLHKPVTPAKYSLVFDPSKQREASRDLKMRNAQQVLESQKDIFKTINEFVGRQREDRGRTPRLLLAEDNPVNQKVMGRFFAKAGLDCEIAKDGVECTSKVFAHEQGYYDFIICDLDMPRKNGFDTCSDIRAWEKRQGNKSVAIVALSAYVMSDMADQCYQVGFTRYISKPIDFEKLKDLIIEVLD